MLPAAVLGLLNPLVAAVAMAASSLLVVANSSRSLGVDDRSETVATPESTSEPTPT